MENKKCTACQIYKPLGEFYPKCRGGGTTLSECKSCTLARNKEWRTRNRQQYLEWDRSRYPQTKDKIRKRGRINYIKNRDKIRKRTSEYQKANPDKCVLYTTKRNEIKRGLLADLTPEQWGTIKAVFKNKCAYCGKRTNKLEKEHVIPLSKGGTLTLRNIVPACRSCNSRKSNNLPEVPVKILLF